MVVILKVGAYDFFDFSSMSFLGTSMFVTAVFSISSES